MADPNQNGDGWGRFCRQTIKRARKEERLIVLPKPIFEIKILEIMNIPIILIINITPFVLCFCLFLSPNSSLLYSVQILQKQSKPSYQFVWHYQTIKIKSIEGGSLNQWPFGTGLHLPPQTTLPLRLLLFITSIILCTFNKPQSLNLKQQCLFSQKFSYSFTVCKDQKEKQRIKRKGRIRVSKMVELGLAFAKLITKI